MVVKMIKWSPWPPSSTAVFKKFQVKIKEIKLEGFFDNEDYGGEEREKVMVVKVKWKGGGKPGLVPFHRPSSSSSSSKGRKNVSGETVVKKGEIVKWYDEFENVCSFPIISKDNKIGPWDVSFSFLYGAKTKLEVIGKVSLNLAEMASKMEAVVETKLPVKFNNTGVAREATLLVSLSFVEDRNSQDSAGTSKSSSAQSKNVERKKTGYGSIEDNEDSDKSAMVNLEGESVDCVDANSLTESAILGQTRQLDSVKKPGIFSWKRRKLSFKPGKRNSNGDHVDEEENKIDIDRPQMACSSTHSIESKSRPKLDATEPSGKQESSNAGHWEEKELVSRDGEAKLKASVFLASFDQRSDEAAGESACTALVAVIAYWLQSNLNDMPTRSEFDRLIIEGSTEWQKLCDNEDLMNRFPDKHFDLETVMRAGLRPISVLHDNTYIGFFGAETFKSLKGNMSFDQIWDKINNGIEGNKPRIYIVSWNDHFFVLKVDANAYYIIDTLGERLFEGCNQAYILRFDDSALMHGKAEKEKVSSKEMSGAEQTKPEAASEEEIICSGRECCREFIKRFLAAIPLRELQAQEEKEPVSYFALHQRLQIEINFTSSLSSLSSSSSLTSSTYSLFSNDSVDC